MMASRLRTVFLVVASVGCASLARAQPPRTDLYGDPLPPNALARLGSVRWRLDPAGAEAMTVTADGKTLVTASRAGGVTLMDLVTGKTLRRLPEEPKLRAGLLGPSTAVTLSADGRVAAFGTRDGVVHLLDVPADRESRRLVGHAGAVQELALSRDGKVLATRGEDRTLRVWDTTTGKESHRRAVNAKAWRQTVATELAVAPDGRAFAWIGDGEGRLIHVCDALTGAERARLGEHKGRLRHLAFSPDGRGLLATSDDGPAQLWDWEKGTVVQSWPAKGRQPFQAATFTPDGTAVFLVMTYDGLYLFDTATGKQRWHVPRRLSSTRFDVTAFTPDGKILVSSFGGGAVLYRYEADGGRRVPAAYETEDAFASLGFSDDDRTISSFAADGTLRSWDAEKGKETRRVSLGAGAGSFSPDGHLLAVARGEGVTLYETATGGVLRRLPGEAARATEPLFSPDGRVLAGQSDRAGIVCWDSGTGKELWRHPRADGAYSLCFRARNELVVVSGARDELQLWDVAAGKQVQTWPVPRDHSYPRLSPDGKTLLTTIFGAHAVDFHELATGARRLEVKGLTVFPPASPFPRTGRSSSSTTTTPSCDCSTPLQAISSIARKPTPRRPTSSRFPRAAGCSRRSAATVRR